MHHDLTKQYKSSFMSCEKDMETILRKVFAENPNKETLKRLLVIDKPDCLDNDADSYKEAAQMPLSQLLKEGYVTVTPKIQFSEHAEKQSYIIIGFDNFIPNGTNPQFRDCTISFDVICYSEDWDIGSYRIRPLKICGCIDSVMNNTRLSGIGTLQFISCTELIINDTLAGYTLTYYAVHGSDDLIPNGQ